MTAARVTRGAISLSSSSHFTLMPYSNTVKPVALPPGRARLSMKPPPTGSVTCTNTIGTVRVACSNGGTVESPVARVTSGASAANSAACLRISAASAVAQRVPVRRLVLELQATRRREILGRHRVPVRRFVLEQDGHVHRVLVTRRADGARRVCGQAQHSRVAGQHLCDEAANAASDGILLQAGLQGRSNALPLPLRGYHEGDFGEVRRRV